jgi:hypothetical protein
MNRKPKFVETPGGVLHEGLACHILRIEIDLVRRRAVLWLPPLCCTDMRGAIDLIESIDPRIERIDTMSGANRDTCYERSGRKWLCTVFGGRGERPMIP